ncbi:MAG TPA: Pyrrolo-quinoline quinone, partial [Phycisphaerales bacterium]|nr:Pyrrolo-quinoline quinone [Phycisphaerales bacterium]
RVHCVGRDDGKVLWTFQTLGEVDSSPVICGGKVVVGSEDGRLYILKLSDGSKLWSYETGQPITSSPAVAGGIVVVGCDDGYVYAFGDRQ